MKRKSILILLTAVAVSCSACGSKSADYKDAVQNLENEHYEEAISGYQAAIEAEDHEAQSYRGLGIAQLKTGNYADAITSLAQALTLETGNKSFRKDVLSYKATAEYKSGDTAAALASCEQMLDLGPNADDYYLLGKMQLEEEEYDSAKESFGKSIDKDTTYATYIKVYQAYEAKDMDADGESYLENALKMNARNGEDYYNRGCIYYYMGDYDKSKEELIKAVKDNYTEAQLFLGKLYLSQNDSANARAMYQQYIKDEEDSAKGYNGLALCDMAEENYDSALENIASGLKNADSSETQELLFNQVVAYEKKLDWETAKTKIGEYLQLYPNDAAAIKENTFIQSR